MFRKKSAKPPKKAFTNEQIRARAYQIWEKNKEQSEEDNWNAAIKALEKERRFRVLIGIWRWTGLGDKTGWDIVTSLSIPLFVFVGGLVFNHLNAKQQQEVAEQKQKDDLLKTYINDMKGFLLDEKHSLKKSKENDEIRTIARTITLTTLTQLNDDKDIQISKEGNYNKRKGLILQFLSESGLIKVAQPLAPYVSPVVSLNAADFSFTNLRDAKLGLTNLTGANLTGAYFITANLTGAYFITANLTAANFQGAYLQYGYLIAANLQGANLQGAYLQDADLQGANLTGANIQNVEKLTNIQIKAACHWEKAIYTQAKWDNNKYLWAAKDETANQKKIDEIKQDKASEPTDPAKCSIMWK